MYSTHSLHFAKRCNRIFPFWTADWNGAGNMSLRCEFFSCPTIKTSLHPKATPAISIAFTFEIFWILHITKYSLGDRSCRFVSRNSLSCSAIVVVKRSSRRETRCKAKKGNIEKWVFRYHSKNKLVSSSDDDAEVKLLNRFLTHQSNNRSFVPVSIDTSTSRVSSGQ